MALPAVLAGLAGIGVVAGISAHKKKKRDKIIQEIGDKYANNPAYKKAVDKWIEENPSHEKIKVIKSIVKYSPMMKEEAAHGKKMKYKEGGYANYKKLMGLD